MGMQFMSGKGIGMGRVQAAIAAALAAYVPDPGYLEYVALLTQAGTGAPTLTVLKNTLGGTPVATRTDIGVYRLTLAGAFTTKTVFAVGIPFDINGNAVVVSRTTNYLRIETIVATDLSPVDDVLSGTPLFIRVYP